VSYFRAVLRSALEHAVKTNLVARNVAKLVQPPKTETYSPRFLSPEDAKKLFALAEAEEGGAVFSIALAMGLRLGEALGLKWADVDLAAGDLHVRQALQAITKATAEKYAIRPGLQLMPLKTERSRRTLQMPEPIIERLKAHRRAQLESRLAAGKYWTDTGLVFTNSIGKPLDSANLRKRFKALAKTIGIPRLRLHDLRHSCATLLLAQGVSERTIMEILGHSQISLTLNTYTHVLDTAKKEAATRMAHVLASGEVE
jgi:integrase